jgi:hypothetical protein
VLVLDVFSINLNPYASIVNSLFLRTKQCMVFGHSGYVNSFVGKNFQINKKGAVSGAFKEIRTEYLFNCVLLLR